MDMQKSDLVKVDLEAKIVFLEEENWKETIEGVKFKKGFENAYKVIYDFVGKAKEKAKDAFTDGFCLARKHVLVRNLEADLSSLNGLVRPARSTEWFSPEFLKPAPLDVVPYLEDSSSKLSFQFSFVTRHF